MPYRPTLPPMPGYTERDGQYIKISEEQDTTALEAEIKEMQEALTILIGGRDDELNW